MEPRIILRCMEQSVVVDAAEDVANLYVLSEGKPSTENELRLKKSLDVLLDVLDTYQKKMAMIDGGKKDGS